MPAIKYYQVGGFRPHLRWFQDDWNDKRLLETLTDSNSPLRPSPNCPLQLVLGIGPKGTSHLLLADIQANAFEQAGKKRPHNFATLADYISVSPIWFDSAEDLGQKFKTLRPKQRKGKKDEPWDTSQANKAFTSGNQGLQRGEFEHGRLLYHLLRSAVVVNPVVYSVFDTTWIPRLRVASFVCNLRLLDARPYDIRQRSPRPLDYGWAEADILHPKFNVKQGSAVHIIRSDDRTLQTGRRQVPFEYGKTQILEWNQTMSMASQFFCALNESPDPVLLLVYNKGLAISALRELGVQTSGWKFGIGDLLRGQDYTGTSDERSLKTPQNRSSSAHPNPTFERHTQRSRERSRSPTPRKVGTDTSDVKGLPRRPSPPPSSSSSTQVYIVDIQDLYRTMMQSQSDQHVADLAQKLGVIGKGDAWCAGNEAVYLFQAWSSMISGPAIDEQRTTRVSMTGGQASTSTNVPLTQPDSLAQGDDSDEEFDPNDIVQTTETPSNSRENNDSSYETDWSSDDD